MKTEAYLFGGVAAFLFVTGAFYAWWAQEPVGIAALSVSFVMSALICFFFTRTYQRRGARPEDDKDADIAVGGGPVGFFAEESPYPAGTAFGAALTALGIVFGLWFFLIGFGVLCAGVAGMIFQYARHGD